MAINLPPVVKTSKRTIPGTRVFDASKVFADYNPDASKSNSTSHYRTTFSASMNTLNSDRSHRAGKTNKPDPTNVHFLFENTRFVNEPVCHAATKANRHIQHKWWPAEVPSDVKLKPLYSLESSSRSAFGQIDSSKRPHGLTRFRCVEGKRQVAVGIVPVTELPARHINTERISYDHQFDSRRDMRERGKLHGSWVWDTSQKSKQQVQRRFAKRHFICDTNGMMEQTKGRNIEAPEAFPITPTGHTPQAEGKRTNYEENPVMRIKQSQSLVPQKDDSAKVQNDHDQGTTKLSKEHYGKLFNTGHADSPPPHLC